MAKLAAKTRKRVDKAEAVTGGDFQPLTPGKYVATLSEVDVKNSQAGAPMWVAEFEEITDLEGDRQPGRQWYNLMLPQDTMPEDYQPKRSKKSPQDAWDDYQRLCEGRLKAFFEAFGYTADSDTDEMIGDRVVLQIGVRTIANGARAGEKTNSVNSVLPLDSVDFEDGDEDSSKGDNF